jgi:type 1 glutamine amidotransferase
MLIVTQVAPYIDGPAGVHGVLGQATTALQELATMHDLHPIVATNVVDISPDHLAAVRVLALFTIGETPWSPAQKEAIHTSWQRGTLRILGIHSATDANHQWPEYGAMLGARFDGHPWTQDFVIDVIDDTHPATAHLVADSQPQSQPQSQPSHWLWRDEIYLFADLRPDAHVILRLAPDQVDLTAPGGRTPECGFPLAWTVQDHAARTFYTALGHFPGAWESPAYLRHLSGGLAWLAETA